MKLTPKQKAFADYYIQNPNATEAAIKAGYSKKTARAIGTENLSKPNILQYIEKAMAEKDAKRIAKQDEILEYLSSIMRGEEREQVLKGEGMGEQRIVHIDVGAKDRIKAAELLLKRFPMSKADELKEHLIAAQIKKMEAEIDSMTAGDIDDKFEVIIKRKGVDD
jgi:phage terminase small subunit